METIVLTASGNQVKADAVHQAFELYGSKPVVELAPFTIESGVSDQPLSLEETALGAINRVLAIREVAGFSHYVAIEGGAYQVSTPKGSIWYESACAAVWRSDNGDDISLAYGPAYPIPPRLVRHLINGKDLNEAMEIETGIKQIGSSIGFNGWLTDGKVDRKTGSAQAVLMALYGLDKR